MAPRKRLPENRAFPERWRWKGKSIYYQVPAHLRHRWDGKTEFRLGATPAEAYRTWAERVGESVREHVRTMDHLCDQYALEHVPTLAPKTRESYLLALRRIRAATGAMAIAALAQPHARQLYRHLVKTKGAATARSTCGVLKHLMTMAAEWGLIASNPLLGMRFAGAEPAKRLLSIDELAGILSLEPRTRTERVGLIYIRLALMTGLRRGDILDLRVSSCTSEGVAVTPHKTEDSSGVRALFPWTDELKAATDEALALPPRRIGAAPLIVTREGKSYLDEDRNANGFDSLSRRFIDATLARGIVAERWTMKDLRAAVGSHLGSTVEAQHQLLHSSPAVTEKHYRRAARRVEPVSLKRFQ